MAEQGIPDFLTVPEAAGILRIGRTAAYEQARLWRETDGREGLPVSAVGGQLRVPTALFERHYGVTITTDPRAVGSRRAGPPAVRNLGPARKTPARKPRGGASQDGLPFAG
jgi:hypothetical protein